MVHGMNYIPPDLHRNLHGSLYTAYEMHLIYLAYHHHQYLHGIDCIDKPDHHQDCDGNLYIQVRIHQYARNVQTILYLPCFETLTVLVDYQVLEVKMLNNK